MTLLEGDMIVLSHKKFSTAAARQLINRVYRLMAYIIQADVKSCSIIGFAPGGGA